MEAVEMLPTQSISKDLSLVSSTHHVPDMNQQSSNNIKLMSLGANHHLVSHVNQLVLNINEAVRQEHQSVVQLTGFG